MQEEGKKMIRRTEAMNERIRLAKELYQKGVSIAKISIELGVGRQTVTNYLKEEEKLLERKVIRNEARKKRIKLAKELHQKGVSIAIIGMELDVGRQTVRNYLKEADD